MRCVLVVSGEFVDKFLDGDDATEGEELECVGE